MRLVSRLVVAVCFVLTPPIAAFAADRPATGPNFVMVLIDDLGWGDFSCFGNRTVETQNVDRLAAEGLRFDQFYVAAPICSPSRAALLTGQYPQRWRIGSYLADRALNDARGVAQWLDPDAPTLADSLYDAGYATGHFGKWHLGGQRDVGDAPLIEEYGFDESLTNFEGLGPRVLGLRDDRDGRPPRPHALGSDKLGRGEIRWLDRAQITTAYVDAAVKFIDAAEAEGKPFFVDVWPDDVHSPFHPTADRRGDGTKEALYAGVLDEMDEQLGPLFDRIRDSETLRANTLILICSDNGPQRGDGSAGPFRGFKGQLYEGGIRSPLIVWGPGFVDAAKVGKANRESVLASIDVAPTLLAVAGVGARDGVAFDGQALPDTFLGRAPASRAGPLFFRRPPDRNDFAGDGDLPDLAVREGNWKLLCEYDGSDRELYDLDADLGETNDLAAERPDVAERLAEAVVAWHESLPGDNGATYVAPAAVRRP